MFRKIKITSAIAVLLCFVSVSVYAVTSPVTMLQGIADGMIKQLEQNKRHLRDRSIIDGIVDRTLVSHVALDRMGMAVVGRQYWAKASADQRATFVRQFTRLVTSTYAAALASYDGDVVRFYPLRVNFNARRVMQVNSVIIRRSGRRIPIIYNLVRDGNGWKIYDFSIENVSMVNSYRAQFAEVLANSGMPGLLSRLERHNRRRR